VVEDRLLELLDRPADALGSGPHLVLVAADYLQMFRVLRQPTGGTRPPAAASDGTTLADVPPRIRSASNPGGPGHLWVRTRFVDPATRAPGVGYVQAKPTDNPHLDLDSYLVTLANLPRAQRERLLYGNWEVPDDGELFERDWFEPIERGDLPRMTRAVRYWDLAATAPSPANRDPDYTCGLRLETDSDGTFYITDIILARQAPGAIERLMAETAEADGRAVAIAIEQEPGAAGVHLAQRFKRDVLRGYTVRTPRATGDKITRAHPVCAAAENGFVKLVCGRNTPEFLDQISSFPNGSHDDCVDALAGAHTELIKQGGPLRSYLPQGRIPINHFDRQRGHRRTPRDIHELAAAIGVPVYDSRHGY
jgi:predicted phage terminase large subunit-like protein